MILEGKSVRSFSEEMIYPFLNKLLQSDEEGVVKNSLTNINILIDEGIDGKPFLDMQRTLYHNNSEIAHSSLDILRKISSGTPRNTEVEKDVWKGMFPFFCDQASSAPDIAMDSLKIIEGLIDRNIIDDAHEIQKILYHENEVVAHLALDILRKKKSHVEEIDEQELVDIHKKQGQEEPELGQTQKKMGMETRVKHVLKKNPKYAQLLDDVRSKHKME
jgi:hypothetical protein